MPDPFDFSGLKSFTPKYLGMDSLKESLPTTSSSNSFQTSSSSSASMDVDEKPEVLPTEQDVSMADQELSDEGDDVEQEENNAHKDNSFLHSLMSPTQTGAHMALNHPHQPNESRDDSKPTPQNEVLPPSLHVSPLPPSHLQPVLPHEDYGYEVRMPIPAPWHENLPYIISTYLQLAYNAGVLALIAYLVHIVNCDVGRKMEERRAEVVRDATWCQHQYVINQCGTGMAPPHLVDNKGCLELEHCMEADPENVRRLSMYASLVAEIVGEFIQPLSLRTILSLGAVVVLMLTTNFGINYIFGFIRARTYLTNRGDDLNSRKDSDNNSSRNEIRISARKGPNANSSGIWRREN